MLPFLVAKETTKSFRNEERKAELRMMREFPDKLIREGKAREFLVKHGFVKPSGGLTKRYGG